MVDKISSWKFAEDFTTETAAIRDARGRAEEFGVEQIDVVERGSCGYVIGTTQQVRRHAGRQQLLGRKHANGFDPVNEVLPELIQVVSTGESPRHPNDRNRVTAMGHRHVGRGRVFQRVAFHERH